MFYFVPMNIFILDTDPAKAAAYHCNRHVVKMALETAQILSTVVKKYNPEAEGFYKPTHMNHPCVKWTSVSRTNFEWTLALGFALCDEYTKRYGKIHKSEKILACASQHIKSIPEGGLTPFVQAMPDDVKDADTVKAYRRYYVKYKADILQWKTQVPYWILTFRNR